MNELADAIIALPGGYGTFEELFEAITWAQLGIHQKPIGLLNTLRYFNPLLQMVQNALDEGFIYPEHLNLLISASEPAALINSLRQYTVPRNLDRWVNRESAASEPSSLILGRDLPPAQPAADGALASSVWHSGSRPAVCDEHIDLVMQGW